MIIEDVKYDVDWVNFVPGSSIFIPCLRPEEAQKKAQQVLKRLKFEVVIAERIEENVRGLRIWRI